MKLSVARTAAFIERPDKTLALFLLYGPDSGLVAARGMALARQFVADISDPFAVAEVSADALAAEPARLADELATMPMLGGWRLVRVRGAGDNVFAAADHALSHAPTGQAAAIIEAGDLDKRSKLRSRIEDDARAMALPCYPEEGAALDKSVHALLSAEGFSIDADARAALHALLPPDHLAMRAEIEKLILYVFASPARRITLADVEAALTDGSAEDVDAAVWAAGGADLVCLDRELARLAAQGTAPVQLLRAMQRHLLRLYEVKAMMAAEGKGIDDAIKSLRPPVFFKRENAMRAQVSRWTLPALQAGLGALAAAEAQTKMSGLPAERIAERALFGLARLSAR